MLRFTFVPEQANKMNKERLHTPGIAQSRYSVRLSDNKELYVLLTVCTALSGHCMTEPIKIYPGANIISSRSTV